MISIQNSYPITLYHSPHKSEPETETEETDAAQIGIHVSKQKKVSAPKMSKIKSSLCKNFMTMGSCPYGQRCQFAHGPHQLKCNTVENTSYKTKPCFSFINKGFCPYGHRCNFIHQRSAAFDGVQFQQKMQNFPEMVSQYSFKNSSRLLPKLCALEQK